MTAIYRGSVLLNETAMYDNNTAQKHFLYTVSGNLKCWFYYSTYVKIMQISFNFLELKVKEPLSECSHLQQITFFVLGQNVSCTKAKRAKCTLKRDLLQEHTCYFALFKKYTKSPFKVL